MVGPVTMKLGTLMYHDRSSSKHKLRVCTQQQPQAIKICVNHVCAHKLLMVGLKHGTQIYHGRSSEITSL